MKKVLLRITSPMGNADMLEFSDQEKFKNFNWDNKFEEGDPVFNDDGECLYIFSSSDETTVTLYLASQ